MKKKPKPEVVEMDDAPAEIIAQAILDISNGMKAMNNSRLQRRAIVALIHDYSGVSKGTINLVLNNLEALETIWLKGNEKKNG